MNPLAKPVTIPRLSLGKTGSLQREPVRGFGVGVSHFPRCQAQMDLQAESDVWYDFYRIFIFGAPKWFVPA